MKVNIEIVIVYIYGLLFCVCFFCPWFQERYNYHGIITLNIQFFIVGKLSCFKKVPIKGILLRYFTHTSIFCYVYLIGNIVTGQKEVVIPGCRRGLMDGAIGHTGHVLALAISSDGQYLVSISMLDTVFPRIKAGLRILATPK